MEQAPCRRQSGRRGRRKQTAGTFQPATPPTATLDAADINGDGLVTPHNMLLLVNHLNGVAAPPDQSWLPRADLNRDGRITPS